MIKNFIIQNIYSNFVERDRKHSLNGSCWQKFLAMVRLWVCRHLKDVHKPMDILDSFAFQVPDSKTKVEI